MNLDPNKTYKCTICKEEKACTKEFFYSGGIRNGIQKLHEKCKECYRKQNKEDWATPEKRKIIKLYNRSEYEALDSVGICQEILQIC